MLHQDAARVHRGQMAYHGGLAAELAVERCYIERGSKVLARRWRGKGGEIDLILRDETGLVFVEVKKSRSFAEAAARVGRRQTLRIFAAATEFATSQPDGLLSCMRFDVALCDAAGAIQILENALYCD